MRRVAYPQGLERLSTGQARYSQLSPPKTPQLLQHATDKKQR